MESRTYYVQQRSAPQKDMKTQHPSKVSGNTPLKKSDTAAFLGTELIYFGHMGLTSRADAILAEYGYGRAHFRALYVMARNPGITSSALIARLKITTQSISRTMTQLLQDGLVVQNLDPTDRRQRLHTLSDKGTELEQRVRLAQFAALNAAYKAAGSEAVEGFLRVLFELIPPEDRGLLTFPMKFGKAEKKPTH
jgi:DNA-binding MarR family transcriptional regulator